MPVMKRPGVLGRSTRVKRTSEAGTAWALRDTNSRPVPVPAHSVLRLARGRSSAETAPPLRLPQPTAVRPVTPRGSQSPHVASKVPVHSLQIRSASASVRSPRP